MSDDGDEGPEDAVAREFATADQMLEDARKAHDVDISKATIVNRLYYACFHAAQAVLYAREFDPRSHGRVQTLLGQELIQSGTVDREFGRFFNDMGTYRRRVDYGSGAVERDTEELLERTAAFVTAMRDCIDVNERTD